MATKLTLPKFNVLRFVFLGMVAGLLSFLVSTLFKAFKIPVVRFQNQFVDFTASTSPITINLREQILQAGFFKEMGLKLVSFFQGTFNFNFGEFTALLLGAVVVAIVGRILVTFLPKNRLFIRLRVLFSFFVGAIALSIVLVPLLGLPFITSFVSMAAYGLALGIIMQILVNFKSLRFLRE